MMSTHRRAAAGVYGTFCSAKSANATIYVNGQLLQQQ
jgi:hypothetical protein